MPAHHIDEVIQNLDRIIDQAAGNESRLGYFPATAPLIRLGELKSVREVIEILK